MHRIIKIFYIFAVTHIEMLTRAIFITDEIPVVTSSVFFVYSQCLYLIHVSFPTFCLFWLTYVIFFSSAFFFHYKFHEMQKRVLLTRLN